MAPHIFLLVRKKQSYLSDEKTFTGVSVIGDRAEISQSAAGCGDGKTLRNYHFVRWESFACQAME